MLEKLEEFLPKALIDNVCALYERNDKAHRLDHVIPVLEHAEMIIGQFGELKPHREHILAGAFMHDMMSWANREQHHYLGAVKAAWLLGQYNVFVYEPLAPLWVANAINEHRASFKGERSHKVSHAVAAADRGPINFEGYFKRAIKFRTKNCDVSNLTTCQITRLVNDALEHLNDKFGIQGYAWERMPNYTHLLYEKEIEHMKNLLNFRETRSRDECWSVGLGLLKKMGADV